jgi:hypothetical protein
MKRESFAKVGMRFKNRQGLEYVVTKFNHSKDITIRFSQSGYVRKTSVARISDGAIKDFMHPSVLGIGFLGGDEYSKKSHALAYEKWKDMLYRCYSKEYHSRQPTYKDCSVHADWHNFQNFAEWFYKNYPNDGAKYQLDKDIKKEGNRVYSSDTCMFVTHKDNSSHSHSKKASFVSPEGKIFNITNIKSFSKKMGLNSSHMCAVNLGKRKSHQGWKAFIAA